MVEFTLEIHGPDQPGIVSKTFAAIRKRGGAVKKMGSEVWPAPHAGYDVFNLSGIVEVPTSVKFKDLKDSLRNVGDKMGLDITLTEQVGGAKLKAHSFGL